jgi:hypothetical protein
MVFTLTVPPAYPYRQHHDFAHGLLLSDFICQLSLSFSECGVLNMTPIMILPCLPGYDFTVCSVCQRLWCHMGKKGIGLTSPFLVHQLHSGTGNIKNIPKTGRTSDFFRALLRSPPDSKQTRGTGASNLLDAVLRRSFLPLIVLVRVKVAPLSHICLSTLDFVSSFLILNAYYALYVIIKPKDANCVLCESNVALQTWCQGQRKARCRQAVSLKSRVRRPVLCDQQCQAVGRFPLVASRDFPQPYKSICLQ